MSESNLDEELVVLVEEKLKLDEELARLELKRKVLEEDIKEKIKEIKIRNNVVLQKPIPLLKPLKDERAAKKRPSDA